MFEQGAEADRSLIRRKQERTAHGREQQVRVALRRAAAAVGAAPMLAGCAQNVMGPVATTPAGGAFCSDHPGSRRPVHRRPAPSSIQPGAVSAAGAIDKGKCYSWAVQRAVSIPRTPRWGHAAASARALQRAGCSVAPRAARRWARSEARSGTWVRGGGTASAWRRWSAPCVGPDGLEEKRSNRATWRSSRSVAAHGHACLKSAHRAPARTGRGLTGGAGAKRAARALLTWTRGGCENLGRAGIVSRRRNWPGAPQCRGGWQVRRVDPHALRAD